jgi:hypothetical protein
MGTVCGQSPRRVRKKSIIGRRAKKGSKAKSWMSISRPVLRAAAIGTTSAKSVAKA